MEPVLAKEMRSNKDLRTNWAVVRDWSENTRYQTTVLNKTARNLYSAVASRKNGVLAWLKKQW